MPQSFQSNVLRLLLLAMLLTGFATFGVLAWFLFLDPVTPLESTRLVRLEVVTPPGRNSYLVVTREFCFSRPSEAEVSRLFRRVSDGVERGEVIEVPPIRIHLDGPPCYARPRRIDLPDGIGPGRYEYIPIMRWSNAIGRPVSVQNSSVLFEVRSVGDHLVIVSAEEVR